MPSGETIEILYGNLISFMHFHSGFCFHEFNLAGCFGAGKARLIHCKKTNPELRNALKRGAAVISFPSFIFSDGAIAACHSNLFSCIVNQLKTIPSFQFFQPNNSFFLFSVSLFSELRLICLIEVK